MRCQYNEEPSSVTVVAVYCSINIKKKYMQYTILYTLYRKANYIIIHKKEANYI